MTELFNLKRRSSLIIFIIINTICIAMGMGVPIFAIILGFFIGWFSAKYLHLIESRYLFRRILFYSVLTSAVTFFEMLIIWGSSVTLLFDDSFDFSNYGQPMILYDPEISFIAWLILMIFISPFLQMLMTMFGFHLRIINILKKDKNSA